MTLSWANVRSLGISIKSYRYTESSCRCSQVSIAHLKTKIICVWRALQPLRCLSSQLRPSCWGGGRYCLSLAAGQAWQKCKVLGLPPELCFSLDWQVVPVVRLLEECVSLQLTALQVSLFSFSQNCYRSTIPTPWLLWSQRTWHSLRLHMVIVPLLRVLPTCEWMRVGVCLGWLSVGGGCLGHCILLAWIHSMNIITYWNRLPPSYSTNASPCALVRQWCTCDRMEGVEWPTWVSSSHTSVTISNTAQDPPTPLGTLGFSWIPTHHRASPVFVPLLIKHPDSNIVFLLWQVCYVIKSSFLEGFPSLCTNNYFCIYFFKITSLACSSLWTGENCLTQSLFIWSEKEENHVILY